MAYSLQVPDAFEFLPLLPEHRIHGSGQFTQPLTKATLIGIARRGRLAFWRLGAGGLSPRLPLTDQGRLPRPLFGCPFSRCHDAPLQKVRSAEFRLFLPRA